MSVRRGVASLDDVLAGVRVNHYLAETVVLAWDKRHMSAAVMGLLGEDGSLMDVSPDVLARLSGQIARPLTGEVVRLAFPDADTALSGQLTINMPVDEPVWARVLSNVDLKVQAGLRVSSDDIRDALWLTLEAAALPNGSATLDRTVLFPELPDDIVFTPAKLSTMQAGAGVAKSWDEVAVALPHPEVERAIVSLLNALALRQERESNASLSEKVVVTRSVVSI